MNEWPTMYRWSFFTFLMELFILTKITNPMWLLKYSQTSFLGTSETSLNNYKNRSTSNTSILSQHQSDTIEKDTVKKKN